VAAEDFDAFYESTAPGAYRLALALTGSPHEAQDLTQAVFERLYRRWRRLSIEDPQAFVRVVTARTFISERRRARWSREQPLPEAPVRHDNDFSDVVAESGALLDALRRLPLRQREAVVLRYLEDMPVAEVAALMRCSPGSVKRSASDGLRNLRAALSNSSVEQER
jgi:RNA polymerase sigma-70 factor (sigma-E family)